MSMHSVYYTEFSKLYIGSNNFSGLFAKRKHAKGMQNGNPKLDYITKSGHGRLAVKMIISDFRKRLLMAKPICI